VAVTGCWELALPAVAVTPEPHPSFNPTEKNRSNAWLGLAEGYRMSREPLPTKKDIRAMTDGELKALYGRVKSDRDDVKDQLDQPPRADISYERWREGATFFMNKASSALSWIERELYIRSGDNVIPPREVHSIRTALKSAEALQRLLDDIQVFLSLYGQWRAEDEVDSEHVESVLESLDERYDRLMARMEKVDS
jgi:hypothetical protein